MVLHDGTTPLLKNINLVIGEFSFLVLRKVAVEQHEGIEDKVQQQRETHFVPADVTKIGGESVIISPAMSDDVMQQWLLPCVCKYGQSIRCAIIFYWQHKNVHAAFMIAKPANPDPLLSL